MANFVTEDDKRIRDCQDYGPNDLLETDFFVTDRPNSPAARRQTVQRLINKISTRGAKQIASSGTANPDNANGLRGDFYFKAPLDASSLSLYQKNTSTWSLIFSIPIGNGSGSGIPSRVYADNEGFNFSSPDDLASIDVDCTGSERVISILKTYDEEGITKKKTLDFIQEDNTIYAEFSAGNYNLNIIIQGYPEDLPEPGSPLNGLVSSGPNTFTFTPSDEL